MDLYKQLPLTDERPCFHLLELNLEDVETDTTSIALQVTMNTCDLEDAIDYEALSYTWGPNIILGHWGGGFLQRYYRFKPTHLFRAAGSSRPKVTVEHDSDSIRLEGSRLDTVQRVIPIKAVLRPPEDTTVEIIQRLARDAISSETYPLSGEPSWIAYFRTLTADRSALSPRISEEAWKEIARKIGTIIEDKDIFVTEKGYLGHGHEELAEADLICIFSGGEVPFMLRETVVDDSEAFRFLCECYIHGVMDGEAYDDRAKNVLESFTVF
ncbi:hypothetical protein M501DRAFT_1013572 [Patellaria atrata CBS 101060]|uniref:Heterokaryon incompatibility domain-containing protein n=1 Tax=Patellaria atrata CBS 101060 TaxID=1346257 RepID=A0A9P4VUQ1_9PEZI|nr:hypothetical protein M501DRAFT_1013572 [Patellaria atrata CBS 101060]